MSLQKGFFTTSSYNPDLPPEEWTLVQEITTAGAYSTTLGWGKYKIVISGGGGSGGASSATHSDYRNWADNGYAGGTHEKIVNVSHGTNKTISGTIGQGGQPSYAYAQYTLNNVVHATATPGNGGTGYQSGTKGGSKIGRGDEAKDASAAAGGAGGGSTSLRVDSGWSFAVGGNGGAASADEIGSVSGGTGGTGGTTTGTGAAGGNGAFGYKSAATSGAGSDGYVRIYKSNLYPEPL